MRTVDNRCIQWLGEAIGWRRLQRTDESPKDCHYNYTEGKEDDPYKHMRKTQP
jgi:hypothetical protein